MTRFKIKIPIEVNKEGVEIYQPLIVDNTTDTSYSTYFKETQIDGEIVNYGGVYLLEDFYVEQNESIISALDKNLILTQKNSIAYSLISGKHENRSHILKDAKKENDFFVLDKEFLDISDFYKDFQETFKGIYNLPTSDYSIFRFILLNKKLSELVSVHESKFDENYVKYFFFGLIYFLNNYFKDAKLNFSKALDILDRTNNKKFYLYLKKMLDEIFFIRNVKNNAIENVIVLNSPDDESLLDTTYSSNIIGTINNLVHKTHIINSRLIKNKKHTLSLIYKYSKSNNIIVATGHASTNGFVLYKRNDKPIYFTSKDLKPYLNKFTNTIFIDQSCTDQHFNLHFGKSSWTVIYPGNKTLSRSISESYMLGFLSALKYHGNLKESHIAGQYTIALIDPDYTQIKFRNSLGDHL